MSLPGVTQPFPNIFDPAGFLNNTSIRDVRRWRESEITHGRVAMLAALGFIIGEQLEDFPAFVNADGHITGPAITHFQQASDAPPGFFCHFGPIRYFFCLTQKAPRAQVEARGAIFWEPLVLCIGLLESYRVALGWATPKGTGFNSLKDDYEMGELQL